MPSTPSESRDPTSALVASLVTLFLFRSALERWAWLTNMWYPAEWSRGWLGFAACGSFCVTGILYFRYPAPPFSSRGPMNDSEQAWLNGRCPPFE